MINTVQQQVQDTEPTPGVAFKYLGDLLSEYMKTLPAPVRAPVLAMVNQSTQAIGIALNEWLESKQEEQRASIAAERGDAEYITEPEVDS